MKTFSHTGTATESHSMARMAFPILSALLLLTQVSLGFSVFHGNYWLAVPLVLLSSHLMHGMVLGFHEASHGLLRRSRLLNELDGLIIGTLSLISFSLYRASHQLHHAYLASERDEELWPFVHPRISRGARVCAAIIELTMGLLFTPFLFVRTFLRRGSPIRTRRLRRRIWLELAAMAVVWTGILTAVAALDLWKYFLWLHLIPAWLAANMQSLRKYVEHVGLSGSTVNSSTRSIIAEGWLADFVNFTLLHEPYHGVHHWRSSLPHPKLPDHADILEPRVEQERPPFRSFGAAVHDLFINLSDPRVGAQWIGIGKTPRQELASRGRKASSHDGSHSSSSVPQGERSSN